MPEKPASDSENARDDAGADEGKTESAIMSTNSSDSRGAADGGDARDTLKDGPAAAAQAAPAAPPAEPRMKKDEELAAMKEKMLRVAADFENFRKRTKRELGEREDRARADVIKIFLPAVDNFERALEHLKESVDVQSVTDGVTIIYRTLLESMEKIGVKKIEAIGSRFDPALHEAFSQQETADHPPGSITTEILPGYTLKDKLLRAALVVVAREPYREQLVGRTVEDDDEDLEASEEDIPLTSRGDDEGPLPPGEGGADESGGMLN